MIYVAYTMIIASSFLPMIRIYGVDDWRPWVSGMAVTGLLQQVVLEARI